MFSKVPDKLKRNCSDLNYFTKSSSAAHTDSLTQIHTNQTVEGLKYDAAELIADGGSTALISSTSAS